MRISPTSHEHSGTTKVYIYEGDFDVGDVDIRWSAEVRHGEEPARRLSGSIPLSSPAIASVGEQAVRDEIVSKIDAIVNREEQ